ncbi:Cysteine-rich protein 1 [Liparis tanakae]|uniref:Cysteine-rich protein 1 n=1 Tax=Liparis tanakae TaxID=230148 RepID=A0A4Z2GUW3_9TELE|nr:Cysteine-rich protein 1 [Liparis tanakae]
MADAPDTFSFTFAWLALRRNPWQEMYRALQTQRRASPTAPPLYKYQRGAHLRLHSAVRSDRCAYHASSSGYLPRVSSPQLTQQTSAAKMPKCPKCEKEVYFAERVTSLGKDWHRPCLKCEKCNKTLSAGSHAEHEGKPYCHNPCYSAMFGPKGFGRGGTESHSFT